MLKCTRLAVVALNLAVFAALAEEGGQNTGEDSGLEDVFRGEVQSCRGCSLNRLPDVKTFIYGDLPKYAGVEFHPIPGAVPHLVLFNKADKELERIDLSSLSREECNELVGKWFTLKAETDSGSKEASKEEL